MLTEHSLTLIENGDVANKTLDYPKKMELEVDAIIERQTHTPTRLSAACKQKLNVKKRRRKFRKKN